jgi:hypothetical protein
MQNNNQIFMIIFSSILDSCSHIQGWRASHKESLIFYEVMGSMQSFDISYLYCIINNSLIKIFSRTIEPNTFDYCVERILQAISFFLLLSK